VSVAVAIDPTRLPVLPLKETVVFPESMTPLAVGQERSIKLIDDVVAGERMLALLTVRDADAEQPGWEDVYEVGTLAVVHKMIRVPDGTLRILVQGLQRIRLLEALEDETSSPTRSPSRPSRATCRRSSGGSSR
jgi:ATP-dependent Lon protease